MAKAFTVDATLLAQQIGPVKVLGALNCSVAGHCPVDKDHGCVKKSLFVE